MDLIFPTLTKIPDSKKFSEHQEDATIRQKMEGGYVYTRPKFTRAPRRTFRIGFTEIPQADKEVLDQFWRDVRGGADIFKWTHPITAEVIRVRFMSKIEWAYVGYGTNYRWNADGIELEEV